MTKFQIAKWPNEGEEERRWVMGPMGFLMAGAMLSAAALRRPTPDAETPGQIKTGPGMRPPSSKSKRIAARREAQQAAWEAREAKRQAKRGAAGGV